MSVQSETIDEMIETIGVHKDVAPAAEDVSTDTTTQPPEASQAEGSTADPKVSDDTEEATPETLGAAPEDTDWESRAKKQQAEWTKEHEKRLELERKLEEALGAKVEAPVAPPPLDAEALAKFSDKFDEDPAQALQDVIAKQNEQIAQYDAKLEAEIAKIRNDQQAERISSEEVAMRKEHEDYDDIILNSFGPECEANPGLLKKWQESGATAVEAYALGLKVKAQKEFLDDPEAAREKLRNELLEELKGGNFNGNGKKKKGSALANINSESSAPGGSSPSRPNDPLDGFYNSRDSEQRERYQRVPA